MLLSLNVKNFAIIDEAEINFGEKLNILTGETGAGKSILIGSVNVALGAKVTKDIIGRNDEYALVELTFSSESESVIQKMDELGLSMNGDEILISRKILQNGRTISKINGETVTAAEVREMAMLLMNVHGQNEHQTLLNKAKHLELVDSYAGIGVKNLKRELSELCREHTHLSEEQRNAVCDSDVRLREIDYLRFTVDEIDGARLVNGEDEELKAKFRRLSNARLILEGLGSIYKLTGDEDGCSLLIGHAVKQLDRISEYDGELGGYSELLGQVESLLSDFNREIYGYIDSFEDSAEELETVEARLDLINRLKSKYGNSICEIISHRDECVEKLKKYEQYDEYLEELRRRLQLSEQKLTSVSQELTKIRKEAAASLTGAIREAMQDLNFNQACFEMEFKQLEKFGENGWDDAQFLISLNPGEAMQPLSKVASGGELSRIMLAIKSVFADADETQTLIFDEIDAGISGRTAQKVAEKLVMIAGSHQVICITHLPQIAAMADSHYIIEKSSEGDVTTTTIRELDQREVVEELSRIIGGAEITDSVNKSAGEMKSLAEKKKKEIRKIK